MAKKAMDEATKKRVRAGRLLQKGKTPAQIALDVGVARQTVYTWKALFDEGGIEALRAVPLRSRPARLDEAQREELRRAILQNPTEHGFGTELWTLKRVGVVINRLHGVKFSQAQIWRILGSLGFSPQKPDKRAIERNEDVVRSWKRNKWPALKKSPARGKADRLYRRIGPQRAPHAYAHLGTQGSNSRHPVSLQLASHLGHCGPDTNQLLVQDSRGQHQERRACRISQSAQGSSETALAGDLGWRPLAPQPLGSRLRRQPGRAYSNCLSAALCARSQSGGIYVGLAQTTRHGQLLSRQPERAANDCTQQAQECAETTPNHRRLLETGKPLVMS